MSSSKAYLSEKLIEGYVKSPLSLKEQTLTKIAIQLCTNSELKKHILLTDEFCYSVWQEGNLKKSTIWQDILKQSAVICKRLPLPTKLETGLTVHLGLVAVELSIWTMQHQKLYDISPNVTTHFLTSMDWTAEGKLKERQVAKRLVQDERIKIHQRYRIACVYCLEPFIFILWDKISLQHQKDFCVSDKLHDQSKLVKLWSNYLALGADNLNVHEDEIWQYGLKEAVKLGERTAVIHFWEALSENIKQEVVVRAALDAICMCRKSESFRSMRHTYAWRTLKRNYIDILCFLLSQMSEEQKEALFLQALESNECILKCFIEWPHHDLFLPMIRKYWNILPGWIYMDLLSCVACECIRTNAEENQYYDYGGLLIELLAQSPETFKRYIFCGVREFDRYTEAQLLLDTVIHVEPFGPKTLWVLQIILQEATAEEKQSIVYSSSQFHLCESLILEGNLELMNWLLTQCLSEEVIPDFKKQFFLSDKGRAAYFKLMIGGNKMQENLFWEWGMLSVEEILELKHEILEQEFKPKCKQIIGSLNLSRVDRIITWCLPCKDAQKQFKKRLADEYGCGICFDFIKYANWEKLDQFLFWCFPSRKAVKQFKEEIFPAISTDVHYWFMCHDRWQDAIVFFKWFRLSPKAIKHLKRDTLSSYDVIDSVHDKLCNLDNMERFRHFFKWCFFDEQSLLDFKNKIEQRCAMGRELIKNVIVMQNANFLVKERLDDLTSKQSHEMKRTRRNNGDHKTNSSVVAVV